MCSMRNKSKGGKMNIHFNVSYVNPGDTLPNDARTRVNGKCIYIHNLKVIRPEHSLWRMQSDQARELAEALIKAADHLDEFTPPHPVWSVSTK